jgi:putative aldouronate transport system permease protein
MGGINKRKGIQRFWPLYTMMIPGLLYLFINNYLPMFGLVIAFKRVNFRLGILKSPWVGFENFRYLFLTPDAFIITRNTIVYNLVFIIISAVTGILIGLVLNEVKGKLSKSLYQNFILLPYLISMVIVSYLVYAFLSMDTGLVNKSLLKPLGMEEIMWYQEKKYWPFILVFVNTWKGFGFNAVIYLSSIVGISSDYYEAAYLDGAGKIKQIWHITLPLLKPTVIILTLLAIGRMFYSDFGLFYQVPLNQGLLYDTTNVIDTYVYRALLVVGDIGMSSAVGFYQSLVGFICIMAANWAVRKIEPGSALF